LEGQRDSIVLPHPFKKDPVAGQRFLKFPFLLVFFGNNKGVRASFRHFGGNGSFGLAGK